MIGAALAFWVVVSPLVGCFAGRFIRAGTAESQQEAQS